MGIINVTPDSFYAGSRIPDTEQAVEQALRFAGLGADIVDIGGESTRPGSLPVPAAEEIRRVIPVVEGVRKRSEVTISVDTSKPEVAEAALDCGAELINDITGLGTAYTFLEGDGRVPGPGSSADSGEWYRDLGRLIAARGAYVILMHMRGVPADMQTKARTTYCDVTAEVSEELDAAVARAREAGIGENRIILDPGIGFAKTAEQNLLLLKNLSRLKEKGYPVLVGLSRKSFLGRFTEREPEDRLAATVAANAISIAQGADIIRVHDVGEAVDTVRIVEAILNS
jgi:dihydropteroate synthase